MGIISWIVIGILAGVFACTLTRRTTSRDFLVNIIVGLVGAVLGGFASNLVTFQPPLDFNFSSALVASFGALVFLVFANAMVNRPQR
jgi:uncharacterized membrane protein YeaQ/YmgE (transglycosylase-associated protein family)